MNVASTGKPLHPSPSHSGQLCCSDLDEGQTLAYSNAAHPFHFRHGKERKTLKTFTNCVALFVQIQFVDLAAALTVRLKLADTGKRPAPLRPRSYHGGAPAFEKQTRCIQVAALIGNYTATSRQVHCLLTEIRLLTRMHRQSFSAQGKRLSIVAEERMEIFRTGLQVHL